MYVILFFRQFQVKKVKKNISSIDRELSSPKPKPTCPSEFFYFELFSKHFWNSGFCERSSFRDLFLPAALGKVVFGMVLWTIGTACCPCMPKLWAEWIGLGRVVALWTIGTAGCACLPKLWAGWLCPDRPGKFIALREGTACACMLKAWADWTCLVCLGRVAALGVGTTGGGGARLVVRDLRLGALDLFNVGTGGGGKFGKPMGLDICAGGGGAGRQGFLCLVSVDVCGGIALRSTISISCGDIWLDWNAVLFWLLLGCVTNGSEKLTDRCLGGRLMMLEFLFLLVFLLRLTLSTVKAIQQFRRSINPAPENINAITLPKERW